MRVKVGGHRGLGIYATSAQLFAVPPCTVSKFSGTSKFAYALSSGVCPDRGRASRTLAKTQVSVKLGV